MTFGDLQVATGTELGDSLVIPDNRILTAFLQTGSTGMKPQIQALGYGFTDLYTEADALIQAGVADRWYSIKIPGSATKSRLYKSGGFSYSYSYYEIETP